MFCSETHTHTHSLTSTHVAFLAKQFVELLLADGTLGFTSSNKYHKK